SMQLLFLPSNPTEKAERWISKWKPTTTTKKVVKGRKGRVWEQKRKPGKKVSSCAHRSFPLWYLWGQQAVYVVLKPKNEDQYNYLAAIKSSSESKYERSKKRASKKS